MAWRRLVTNHTTWDACGTWAMACSSKRLGASGLELRHGIAVGRRGTILEDESGSFESVASSTGIRIPKATGEGDTHGAEHSYSGPVCAGRRLAGDGERRGAAAIG